MIRSAQHGFRGCPFFFFAGTSVSDWLISHSAQVDHDQWLISWTDTSQPHTLAEVKVLESLPPDQLAMYLD